MQLLELRLDRQLQRIFRFLGIKYPPNDVEPILNIILTGKEEQRIHAIEFLDNILDSQLKKELIPIAESVLVEAISEEKIKKLKKTNITTKTLFNGNKSIYQDITITYNYRYLSRILLYH